MQRFNTLFATRFSGCPVIATVRDPYRDCLINIHDIGEPTAVGMHDGNDTWIAPAATTFPDLDLPSLINVKVVPRGNNKKKVGNVIPRKALLA